MSSIEGINQHLEELRKRIMRIIIVIGVIFAFIISCHLYPVDIAGFHLYYPALDPTTITPALCGVQPVFKPAQSSEIESFRTQH